MNSYPPELLAQLAPVMFVAGLDSPQVVPNSSSPPPPKSSDIFQVLTLRLRDALLAHRKVAIWQPEKNKSFQVILVDKDIKFPPRKLVPPDDPQYSAAHSPLSPLSQTSPLHPDGLIAPIWIRKHTSLVPSVFVLFLRIFEYPPLASRAPLDIPDAVRERERDAEERRRDSELAAEIAQRKKMTTERGIKLTVVLMASRKMLDDPTLDSRLTFIRRQSGLDSRAALFVLSPVSPAELNDFVRSLQQALYEPAVEYYTAHSKRVRRKRNRHSQNSSGYPNTTSTLGGLNIARPLRSEGWTVRYEYKMACFAEFRSEDEVALKHYQDAYEMLIIMFGSTAILPPRTKRWAEAKVLADCINIKIVKLYLYNNEHALALSHHSNHIRHFGDFSRGWGIGEETFEFWSWIARQHRVLAELLEQGTRSTLVIPVHKPAPLNPNFSQSQQNLRVASGIEYDTLRSLGINPSHALQHPGFYYYMAARCTEMRRSRFLAAVESEEISHKAVALSPGFTNEKKVEHLAIINELYTKSYELFKKHCSSPNQGQGRLTLWIAYRIAQTYYNAGKFDMAVRFFERIAKTYRREKWYSMLRPLLSTWHNCAKQLGDVELSIKLLIEMLGHDDPDSEDPSSLEEDLVAVLKNTVPSAPDMTLIADLVEAHPIFDSNVVFWSSEVKVGEPAAFQLTMTAPTSVSIAMIPFSRLTIHLSNDCSPIVVYHAPSDVQFPIQRVNVGHITGQDPPEVIGNLRWQPEGTIIFTGLISSEVPSVLKITTIVLTVEENGWKVDIPFEPCSTRSGSGPVARWLSSVDPPRFVPIKRSDYSSTLVNHRAHQLEISFQHEAPAYLDQDYPITIEVTNTDICDLDVVVNILLQPTEIDDAVNWIVVNDTRSSSLIKGVQLGVLVPGATIAKTLHLFNTGTGGDRMIDISIQSRTTIAGKHESDQASEDQADDEIDEDNDSETPLHDSMEHLHMIIIPTTNPFKLTHSAAYRHALDPWPGLASLETFDETFWDGKRGGEALVATTLSCVGPSSLIIESMRLERQDNRYAKIIYSSMDEQDEDMLPADFIQGDEISGSCTVSFSLEDEQDQIQDHIDGPGQYVVTWRRILQNSTHGPKATSNFSLPSLRPPVDNIVALLDVPLQGTLHVPILLSLTIRNYHPTRSANIVVQLEPDSMDGFVVSGLRNGRVPVLLPGSEEKLIWNILPIECGYVKVPRIKVMDRRKAISTSQGTEPGANSDTDGDLIKVIDLRRQDAVEGSEFVTNRSSLDERERLVTILVLP